MYVLHGVSSVYSNVSKRRIATSRHQNTKMAYYFSESGSISKKRINKITFYYLKYFVKKWKKRKFVCEECSYIFQALIKSKNDTVDCPKCL